MTSFPPNVEKEDPVKITQKQPEMVYRPEKCVRDKIFSYQ